MKAGRLPLERLALAAGLTFAFLVCLGPISNPDLPWHLAVGRRIVAERAVPRTDFLSWTRAGTPWIDFEWATQLLFYGLDRAAGAAGLWGYKVASFAALGLAVAFLFALWGLSEAWIGLATFAVFAALRPFIQPRPENFSLLFFVLQLLLLESRRLGRLRAPERSCLLAHAALYAAWANLHAGFPMGLLLCACYGLGDRRLLLWAAAGAAGTCLNPYGPRVYAVLWEHGRDWSSLKSLISEWAPPRMGSEYLAGYWLLLAFAIAGFLVCVARDVPIPREHVAAALLFGLAGSRSLRTTAYVTLLVFPLGLLAWSRAPSPPLWRRARPWVVGALAAFAMWRAGAVMARDGFFRSIKPPASQEIPNAAAFLRAEKDILGGLKMFNPYDFGGYLDNELYPEYRVFMDGRYLFAGLLKDHDAALVNPTRWTNFLEKHGVELALMQNTGRIVSFRGQTSWRPFDAYALPQAEWGLVYWDRQVLIFARRSKVPAAWLAQREFRVIRPHDLRYVGLRVLSGWLKLADVEEEIARYKRVIGDPFESAVLDHWLENFKKGLAAERAAARTRPLPDSSRSAAPKP